MKGYYFESSDETLESIESGIEQFEHIIKGSSVAVALGLGQIKRDKLYLDVAQTFEEYIELRRTALNKRSVLTYATIGEKMLKHQEALELHDIRLSKVFYKIQYLNDVVAKKDPYVWDKMQSLSEKEFKKYISEQAFLYY